MIAPLRRTWPSWPKRRAAADEEAVLYVDGGILGCKNPSPRGVYWSVALAPPGTRASRIVVARARSRAYATNNDAEWLACLAGLEHARAAGLRVVRLVSDSRIMVNQFNGHWQCAIPRHAALKARAWALAEVFERVTVVWAPRRVLVARVGH